MTEHEANQILQAEKQKRVSECKKEIEAVLAKHKCSFDPMMILKPNTHPELVFQLVAR